jgi:hypothetical protein
MSAGMLTKWLGKLFNRSAAVAAEAVPVGPNRDLSRCRVVPWPEDMAVSVVSYAGDGADVHYVHADADGPNYDGTFHHAYIGYWADFATREEAEAFALMVAAELERLNGVSPHILRTDKERSDRTRYVLGEISRKTLERLLAPKPAKSSKPRRKSRKD